MCHRLARRSTRSCHLCNLAMLLRRKLRWDPVKEDFIGDEEASLLLSRPQRAPCTIPARAAREALTSASPPLYNGV
jgi:hypothetical protein